MEFIKLPPEINEKCYCCDEAAKYLFLDKYTDMYLCQKDADQVLQIKNMVSHEIIQERIKILKMEN